MSSIESSSASASASFWKRPLSDAGSASWARLGILITPEDSPGPGSSWSNFPLMEGVGGSIARSEEHTSELQSQFHLVCRLLLEKKKSAKEPTATSGPAALAGAAGPPLRGPGRSLELAAG